MEKHTIKLKIERSSLLRRRRNLCRAIELSYGALRSHLLSAIKAPRGDYVGDEKFNAVTIREYAEIILICAAELEFLARKPKRKPAEAMRKALDSGKLSGD